MKQCSETYPKKGGVRGLRLWWLEETKKRSHLAWTAKLHLHHRRTTKHQSSIGRINQNRGDRDNYSTRPNNVLKRRSRRSSCQPPAKKIDNYGGFQATSEEKVKPMKAEEHPNTTAATPPGWTQSTKRDTKEDGGGSTDRSMPVERNTTQEMVLSSATSRSPSTANKSRQKHSHPP